MISIEKSKLTAKISCGSCRLFIEKKISRISETVDVYGDFIDEYYENPSKLFGNNDDKPESNSKPLEINTKNILNALSTHWKNITQLREDLNIESDLDTRYLVIKLKQLERNDRIDVKHTGDEIFWRKVKKRIML